MNTNRTPRTLLAASALTLGIVACDGGAAHMTVEDGVVTETYEVLAADGLTPVQVELTYPEERLGELRHAGVVVVPRTSAPARGIHGLGQPTARPRYSRTIEQRASRVAVVVPAVPPCDRWTAGCDPVPGWMQARLLDQPDVRYEVRLLADRPAEPGEGADERRERARARR